MWTLLLLGLMNPRFFGFVDALYWMEQVNRTTRGGLDAFQVSLFSQGELSDRLRYAMFVELAHGTDTEAGLGYLNLEYAFGELRLRPGLRLRFGKQMLPWGFYNEIHDATHAFLPLFLPTYYEPPDTLPELRLLPVYDAAVQLRWDLPGGEWLIFLDNGPGEPDPYREDQNLKPGVGARLIWGGTWWEVRGTVYGGVPPGDTLLEGAGILTIHLERNPWGLIVEAGQRRQGVTPSLRTTLGEFYYTLGAWTPFLRIEQLEDSASRTQWAGAGLNWSPTEAMVIKLELDRWIHVNHTRAGLLLSVSF